MNIRIPENLNGIARVFLDAGVSAYLVGGFVRNTLLSLPPADLDIASALPPEQAAALMRAHGIKVIPKAADMGTIELHDGKTHVEHTTFREEVYDGGGGHRPRQVRFGTSLERDAFRRDFTVNALYADLDGGALLDPTGGLADLSARVLRATSAPPDIIMGDDALRVLRMVRFCAELGFTPEARTLAAAKRFCPQLAAISPERRRDELKKILLADARYLGGDKARVLSALLLLEELGAWEALIPELCLGRGVAQRPDMHRYTILIHSLHACAESQPALILRLAGLLHDIGKPASFARDGNYHAHAELGGPLARAALSALRFENAVTDAVVPLVENHMYDIQGTAKDATLRRRFALWGRELTRELILVREADYRGTGTADGYVAERWRGIFKRMQAEGAPFSEAELALDGYAIMEILGIPGGAQVGEVKRRLLRRCAVRPADNTPERLAALVREYGRGAAGTKGTGSTEGTVLS